MGTDFSVPRRGQLPAETTSPGRRVDRAVCPHFLSGWPKILTPQITVLDAGGQYCHLIARKVRDLGIYAEVAASETPVSQLRGRKGIIISGGPASVYDPSSPTIDPALLTSGVPVLGIC